MLSSLASTHLAHCWSWQSFTVRNHEQKTAWWHARPESGAASARTEACRELTACQAEAQHRACSPFHDRKHSWDPLEILYILGSWAKWCLANFILCLMWVDQAVTLQWALPSCAAGLSWSSFVLSGDRGHCNICRLLFPALGTYMPLHHDFLPFIYLALLHIHRISSQFLWVFHNFL